jgi:hypothetical protein
VEARLGGTLAAEDIASASERGGRLDLDDALAEATAD